jgi:DNA-directed RNA polymerase sigma subunit (sigma70/sigma32)
LPPVVIETGQRICTAWANIVDLVCKRGAAAKWHLDKARQILGPEDKFGVLVRTNQEDCKSEYVEKLPGLMRQTEAQAQRTAHAWASARTSGQRDDFLTQRQILRDFYRQFEFRELVYERLVNIPEKPFIKQAEALLESKCEHTAEAREIENAFHQTLPEILAEERAIECQLHILFTARLELAKAHSFLIDEFAAHYPTVANVRGLIETGIFRACKHYDYRRGYRFEPYAEWWIKSAVEKLRDVKRGRNDSVSTLS